MNHKEGIGNTMHYDEKYFEWQKAMGDMGGRSDAFKFRPFIKANDTVLDFGCGGAFLLNNLVCKRKLGVEINPTARKYAETQGIEVYESIEQVPDGDVDVVISHHALEHVFSPIATLSLIRSKLKPEAIIVFVVPHDKMSVAWKAGDINMHLYTWNPMTLGNMFVAAGYAVERVDVIRHCWYCHYDKIRNIFGERCFHLFCRLAAYRLGNYQLRVIARPKK